MLADQFDNVNWTAKVRTLESLSFDDQISSFNTSISFLQELTFATILLSVQKRLKIRGYHISQVFLRPLLMTYLINKDFPFIERVNEIIHRVHQSGLTTQWNQESYVKIAGLLLERNTEILSKLEEVNVQPVEMPSLIFYGWTASTIVFVLEIIWKKLNFQKFC